jgi:hypothetical protein
MSVGADKAPQLVQAADVLRRARKLPCGPARNDLRQLAQGLLNLHRADSLVCDGPPGQIVFPIN